MSDKRIYTALGLMSGTSLDGIDAAIIKTDGISISSFGPFDSRSYESNFRNRLREVLGQKSVRPELERELTELHAELIDDLFISHDLSAADIDIIGFHGQTIHHEPENQFTLQLGDGKLLAELTGYQVVNNFRAADVAAGGQGAPFAPIYHQALAADFEKPVGIVNIGGVANVTFVGDDNLLAFDTGPGNAAIDDLMRQRVGVEYDDNGAIAAKGKVDHNVLAVLLDHPYFQSLPPKSLDRNAFDFNPIEKLSTENAAATLVAFTVETIAMSAEHFPNLPRRWLVTGGGRHNSFLMAELSRRLKVEVSPVESVGWNGDALEAQAFAFMAVRSLLKLPLSFPGTTGVPQRITGGDIHPG